MVLCEGSLGSDGGQVLWHNPMLITFYIIFCGFHMLLYNWYLFCNINIRAINWVGNKTNLAFYVSNLMPCLAKFHPSSDICIRKCANNWHLCSKLQLTLIQEYTKDQLNAARIMQSGLIIEKYFTMINVLLRSIPSEIKYLQNCSNVRWYLTASQLQSRHKPSNNWQKGGPRFKWLHDFWQNCHCWSLN